MLRPLMLTAVAAIGLTLPGLAEAQYKHPRMHRAVYEMREAYSELETAPHNFNGHRVQAMQALQGAIQEVELALQAVNDPYSGYTPNAGAYANYQNHPHLRHAQFELREARLALQQANHNFAGHRVRAIEFIDIALVEVRRCIEFAR